MRVLVTGGSGFLGAHCIATLLQHSHSVVFTVRSRLQGEKILSNHPDTPANRFSYVVIPDIVDPHAFDDVLQSQEDESPITAVIHTASPYTFRNITSRKRQILDPAINGTKFLLEAIHTHAASVTRIVLTSSFAAMVNVSSHPSVPYNETHWNNDILNKLKSPDDFAKDTTDLFTTWRASKTLAEHAAWYFMSSATPKPTFTLCSVLPPLMFGPVVQVIPDNSLKNLNTSNLRIRDIIQGKMKTRLEPTGIYIWVDVRDVALAHVRALEIEGGEDPAANRFFVTAGYFSNAQIADVVRKEFPELRNMLPERYESDLDLENKPFEVDNSRSMDVLGLKYRTLEESVTDTVKSLMKLEA